MAALAEAIRQGLVPAPFLDDHALQNTDSDESDDDLFGHEHAAAESGGSAAAKLMASVLAAIEEAQEHQKDHITLQELARHASSRRRRADHSSRQHAREPPQHAAELGELFAVGAALPPPLVREETANFSARATHAGGEHYAEPYRRRAPGAAASSAASWGPPPCHTPTPSATDAEGAPTALTTRLCSSGPACDVELVCCSGSPGTPAGLRI